MKNRRDFMVSTAAAAVCASLPISPAPRMIAGWIKYPVVSNGGRGSAKSHSHRLLIESTFASNSALGRAVESFVIINNVSLEKSGYQFDAV